MLSPIISVIIPVYNAAPYIEECIRSVLQQSFTDIEVIAVNDGSSDNSGSILDILAVLEPRLRVFHCFNKGVSAARNFGLQKAAGKLISFCDADDYMEPIMLEELYKRLNNNNCDWAICNVTMFFNDGSSILRLGMLNEGIFNIAANRSIFLERLMRFYYDNANWNKLYVADIIRNHKLQFDTDMYLYEDLLFNLKYIQFATKVAIIAAPLYNYRVLSNSLYRSNLEHKVQQLNLLFKRYFSFGKEHAGKSEIELFRIEMGRTIYYELLYKTEEEVLKERGSFFRIAISLKKKLGKFNPMLFYFSISNEKGIQKIKKWLLQNRQFTLFTILTALKLWLRKKNRIIS